MRVLVVKHFVIQECCGEIRLNGVPVEGRLPLDDFIKSIETQGYYVNDQLGIIAFKGKVIRKAYRVLLLNNNPIVLGPQDLINDVFDQIKKQVVEYMRKKMERRKKVEEALKKLEQLGEKINELSEAIKNLKQQIDVINKEISSMKASKGEVATKEPAQRNTPAKTSIQEESNQEKAAGSSSAQPKKEK